MVTPIGDRLANSLRLLIARIELAHSADGSDIARALLPEAKAAMHDYNHMSITAAAQAARPDLYPDTLRIEPLAATHGADMALCTNAGVIAIIQHNPDIQTVDDPDFDSVVWAAQDHVNAQRLVAGWNVIARAWAYNDALNVAERVPTADDYNALLDILGV